MTFPNVKRVDACTMVVVVATVVGCVLLHTGYRQVWEYRWGRPDNDRNTHFLTALQLGLDARHLDGVTLFRDLMRIRTWPPLHAVLVASAIALAGPNVGWAVLPNLMAWGGGVVVSYLLARRLVSRHGELAGTASAALYLTSPSHRAFATDFMLESLGSFLTLLCLYLYVCWRQAGRRDARPLALACTLLFFEKYNYWLLVVVATVLAEATQNHRTLLTLVSNQEHRALARRWVIGQLRGIWNVPWAVVLLILLFRVGAEAWHPRATTGGASPPQHANLFHLLWLAILARCGLAWPAEGRWLWSALPPSAKTVVLWHFVPIAVWFALPKRLGYFIWYLGLSNGPNAVDRSLWQSWEYFAAHAGPEYHAHMISALAAVTFALFAIVRGRAVRSDRLVMILFVGMSAFLTLRHPNQKVRFLHTWIPGVWILAGLGIAVFLGWVQQGWQAWVCPWLAKATAMPATPGRLPTLRRAALPALLGVCFALVLKSAGLDAGHSPESGHYPSPSSLVLSETYLPWLDERASAAVLGTLQIESFAEWTYLTRYPHARRPFTTRQMKDFGRDLPTNRKIFHDWLARHAPEQLVLIDIEQGSPFYFPDHDHFRQFRVLVSEQPDYELVREEQLPSVHCSIHLYIRKGRTASPAQAHPAITRALGSRRVALDLP